MEYVTAREATVRYSDGSVAIFESLDAEVLYFDSQAPLQRGANTKGAFVLEVLGGRTYFERTLQKSIVDWLARSEQPGRKTVLIIGDSIRMRLANATGYGLHAYRRLVSHCNLAHVPHNPGGTNNVLAFLENWLQCAPDVIHINAGLHDLAFNPAGTVPPPSYNPPERYAENLERIVEILKASSASKIFWGMNTPVHNEWHRTNARQEENRTVCRKNEDVVAYNEVANAVMERHSIEINDLYTPIVEHGVEKCLLGDGVHLSHFGAQLLGKLVAEKILPQVLGTC